MKFKSLLLLSATLFLKNSLVISDSSTHSDVIVVSEKNFDEIVKPQPLILVEFYAPWCGHCKALAPEYEKAATALKEFSIPIAKVDCTEERDLCASQEVQGYPTLKVFSHGSAISYSGPRKADGIVSYMKKRAQPAVAPVTSINHTDFYKSDRVVIIAYLDESDTSNFEVFKKLAENQRDEYVFGVVHDSSSISEVSSITKPGVVLWKQFDEGRNEFHNDHFTEDNLLAFIRSNAFPLIDEITPNNFEQYSRLELPLAYLFVEANNPNRETLIKSLTPIAKEHKGKVVFVWIDAHKFGDHAKQLGLPGDSWPAFAIQKLDDQSKFPMDTKKPVSPENVAEFAKLFVQGKISPTLKSQPVPKTQGPGAYALVTDAFQDVVHGSNDAKDVFVMFYAPWCGHCKLLKPVWDNLARSFESSSSKVLISKFDATENDVPPSTGITVEGYPTLVFKPAGTKDFIEPYDGGRTLDELISYVEKQSKNGVKAVKVEETEQPEFGTGDSQIVLDADKPSAEEEDRDAEHDEL